MYFTTPPGYVMFAFPFCGVRTWTGAVNGQDSSYNDPPIHCSMCPQADLTQYRPNIQINDEYV